jgi:sec-independent protein translocase protein TatA
MGGLSGSHIFLLLLVGLVLFGGSRIADIGKGMGEGIKNFKKGLKDDDDVPPKQLAEKTTDVEK